jgi:hypothetical protein
MHRAFYTSLRFRIAVSSGVVLPCRSVPIDRFV